MGLHIYTYIFKRLKKIDEGRDQRLFQTPTFTTISLIFKFLPLNTVKQNRKLFLPQTCKGNSKTYPEKRAMRSSQEVGSRQSAGLTH